MLSSHILSEIELIANRMVIIAKGKSIIQGNVAELLNKQELIVSFEVDQTEKALQIIQTKFPALDRGTIGKNILQLHISQQVIPEINQCLTENGVRVFGIDSKRKLEEYFLKLVNN